LAQTMNAAVAKGVRQEPPEGSGIESFEFWLPARRPGGKNMAIALDPPVDLFGPGNLTNGVARPTVAPTPWVAPPDHRAPQVTLRWTEPKSIGRIELGFDTDWDHPLESVLLGHPERAIPFCVKRYRIRDDRGRVIHESGQNHQTRNTVRLTAPVRTA